MKLIEIPSRYNEMLKLLSDLNHFINAQTGHVFKVVLDEQSVPTDNLKEARLIVGDTNYSIEYITNDDNLISPVPVN